MPTQLQSTVLVCAVPLCNSNVIVTLGHMHYLLEFLSRKHTPKKREIKGNDMIYLFILRKGQYMIHAAAICAGYMTQPSRRH